MISVFVGENSFEIAQAVSRRVAECAGDSQQVDGETIESADLPNLLMGMTLFASQRLVVIHNVSQNKTTWSALADWLPRVSDDADIIFVEPKPDKRTKTYKDLQKIADIIEYPAWTDRDTHRAEQWAIDQALSRHVKLDKKSAQTLVARVGVDQWQLYHNIEKLAVFDDITPAIIEQSVDARPQENVFHLFDAALRGDRGRVGDMLRTLRQTDDPYMVFGLLSSQGIQLAALTVTDKPSGEVARDIGAHPFALSKLVPHARTIGTSNARRIVAVFADADTAIKTTATDPWLEIECALLTVAGLSDT